MAILNIRVDDHIRDQLKGMADGEGVTLSEYVRDLLMEEIVPVHKRETSAGGEHIPESMSVIQRLMLTLLYKVQAELLSGDLPAGAALKEVDQMAEILQSGFTGEYERMAFGFRTELSRRDCARVLDILDMFSEIFFAIEKLEEDGSKVDEKLTSELELRGFDCNDPLESRMKSYADFLMKEDRWEELQPQWNRNDRGNSHMRMLDRYLRMLAEYRRIMGSYERDYGYSDHRLSLDELKQISAARIHPANR